MLFGNLLGVVVFRRVSLVAFLAVCACHRNFAAFLVLLCSCILVVMLVSLESSDSSSFASWACSGQSLLGSFGCWFMVVC